MGQATIWPTTWPRSNQIQPRTPADHLRAGLLRREACAQFCPPVQWSMGRYHGQEGLELSTFNRETGIIWGSALQLHEACVYLRSSAHSSAPGPTYFNLKVSVCMCVCVCVCVYVCVYVCVREQCVSANQRNLFFARAAKHARVSKLQGEWV